MALADIISRIDSDAETEAAAILEAAEEVAARVRERARADAERASAERIARAERESAAEADTIRAAARLAARDAALTARRQLIEEVLGEVADAIVALPDDRYAGFFASRIVAAARGGEAVAYAAADSARLASRLPAAVEAAGGAALKLGYTSEPAAVDHGVVLSGDRARVDLSVDAIVAERRDTLEILVSGILFATDGEA